MTTAAIPAEDPSSCDSSLEREERKYDSTLQAWAYLARVAEGPCAPLRELIAQVGPREAADAIRWSNDLPEALLSPTRARRAHNLSEQDLENAAAHGFSLLTPDHKEWPGERFYGFEHPAMQERQKSDRSAYAPYALWVKGDLGLLSEKTLAIVGSRRPSRYGYSVTHTLAMEASVEGYVTISGLACGTDSVVHRTALDAGAPTIAVVAHGLDYCYPIKNRPLSDDIARHGLIVSEYPPGTYPAAHRFLARNRLIAALSRGVLVTSAAWRSGSLNTACWGRDMGRPVMAVPHNIHDPDAAGCHRLLREGATLVTRSEEVWEEVGKIGELALPVQGFDQPTDELGRKEKVVCDSVSPFYLCSVEEIVQESGLETREVLSLVESLTTRGFLREEQGCWQRQRM